MCKLKQKVLLEPYQKAYTSKKFTDAQKKEMFERHSKELKESKEVDIYIDGFGRVQFDNLLDRYRGNWKHIFTAKSKQVNLW